MKRKKEYSGDESLQVSFLSIGFPRSCSMEHDDRYPSLFKKSPVRISLSALPDTIDTGIHGSSR
jgi:hypothetical protein